MPKPEVDLAALRAEAAALGVDVDVELRELDPDDFVREIADSEAAVFTPTETFEWFRLPGSDLVPAAVVAHLEWLEHLLGDGRVSCELYGIVNELGGVPLPMHGHFRLRVAPAGTAVPLYVSFDGASPEWIEQALRRFAVIWPERPGGQRRFMATGPMRSFEQPLELRGLSNRSARLGRNDPCPCGSGLKFKRCHGT